MCWLQAASETGNSVTCIALDLDNFKSINDNNGHLVGDEALRQISKLCKKMLWNSDDTELLARYGGDEFVFLLNETSLKQATERTNRLLSALRNLSIVHDGNTIPVTVSIGIADNAKGEFKTFSDLFYRADQALYASKANGKDQINVFEPMNS